MINRDFLHAGHPPTLFAASSHFDISFMVRITFGRPLSVRTASELHFDAARKGLMVTLPISSGAPLRVISGELADPIGPKRIGWIGQTIVLISLLAGWILGIPASLFAIALPLASRRYPPKHHDPALRTTNSGNPGTAHAALVPVALLTRIKSGWRTKWGAMAGAART
jgi:MFS transporter, NNP family, nitrate/nitrite transporter